ncbi:hypothetical protein PYW07_009656 [Mythimna separata]|uniref:Pacifastin domain-containing protein n=1 Tax=Mythimna separata TaxID=271217 RepID=A0AAD7YCQ3_MYTSE|nr:hypothetical protein PYW07_009656 [Mythimna separata]
MTLTPFLLVFCYIPSVLMFSFQQPVASKVYKERCSKNMIALNDCNWCRCNVKKEYTCDARACNEVDMFGHFNDAIREMDVGMEGHGVWRSEDGACEAGVHYRKDDLLCVCNEDGKWPNPVCRDIYQILHAVEPTEHKKPVENQTCSATKLYLFDCNVCFCPSSGQIDPKLCTKRECNKTDIVARTLAKEHVQEVYAMCIPNKQYKLGCQNCMCLRNNRLLCDNCTVPNDVNNLNRPKSLCHLKKPGAVFKKDCSFCHCDKNDTIYCQAKKCLKNHTEISLPKVHYTLVDQIEDEQNCVPNTKYKKDCNTCHCFMFGGVKYFGCTLKTCTLNPNRKDDETCVEGTSYNVNCLTCHCISDQGLKKEFCTVDPACTKLIERNLPRKLSSMHGYCEPMHLYQKDCNKCKCLADGKTVACTSKVCLKKKSKYKKKALNNVYRQLDSLRGVKRDDSLIMEFIPFVQRGNSCPRGQTYMVDCNVCYCMTTGNAVCTTKDC